MLSYSFCQSAKFVSKCSRIPSKPATSVRRQSSSHVDFWTQVGSGFFNGLSKPTPPVSKNMSSFWSIAFRDFIKLVQSKNEKSSLCISNNDRQTLVYSE